ncbi:MAG: acyl-CoA thioester hydrolase/BAAT C-terminal domain-containing protein [Actinomycetes bacterium]
MKLFVAPADGLVDTVPVLTVDGVEPGTAVEVTVTTTDAAAHRWRSSGDYVVAPGGSVQMEDPERPWWDMRFDDARSAPVAFTASDRALEYEVSVSCPAGSVQEVVRRSWAGDTPQTSRTGDGWSMRLYQPRGDDLPRAAVLVVPGSTGVSAMAPTAGLLAAHGYVAGVLAYMQERGLPSSFQRIPVEALVSGLRAFSATAGVDPDRVAVLAVSVGTAAAIAALSEATAAAVRAVVVVSPTSVVWQGLSDGGPPPKASMLTRDGRDLPYVPIRGEKLLGQMLRHAVGRRLTRRPTSSALRLLPAYSAALASAVGRAEAVLPVERVAAPLLAVAGTDDAMWPSEGMARALLERRRQAGRHEQDRLLVLPGAGHFLRPPVTPTTVDRNDSLVSGGTPEAVARGQRAAWDEILDFLGQHLVTSRE